jgi:hypothetical protein
MCTMHAHSNDGLYHVKFNIILWISYGFPRWMLEHLV